MDIFSFLIAIAGLISSAVVGGLGIYFTHKARTKNYRDLLYQKQLNLLIRIMELAQSIELDASLVVSSTDESSREKYLEGVKKQWISFMELEHKGALLLPVELYGSIKNVFNAVSKLVIQCSKNKETEEDVQQLKVSNARLGLIAREFMGVEQLSAQSINLFSNKKDIEKITGISTDDLSIILEGIDKYHKAKNISDL